MIPDKIRQIESNKEIVQKFTENYNNMTSNTRKYWVKPVRRNVTDKMGQRKNKTKNCKTCDSNPATWESKIVCLYDPFCDGRTDSLERILDMVYNSVAVQCIVSM